MSCELCELKKLTHWYYTSEKWVVLDCLTCKVPMIVLREHRSTISEKEKNDIIKGFNKIRWEMRKIKDHFHCHLEGMEVYYCKIHVFRSIEQNKKQFI